MRKFEDVKAATILNAAAANVISDTFSIPLTDDSAFYIKFAGSAALKLSLQALSPKGDWHEFYTVTPAGSSDGNQAIQTPGHIISAVRAVVTSYSAGNVTVSAYL